MPKLKFDGFMVFVHVRGEYGHRPHVHVWGNSGQLVVLVDPITERENRGMNRNEARKAMRIVAEHREELLTIWERYHGDEESI